jgi:ABC-type branched-subunit amino acid transport system ATPase component/ABC-type branched-subunit amino acid transport system permease subunit
VIGTLTLPGVGFEIPPNVVITGVITGLTYSLIAIGLTLVYRTTRVLNFAAGEMGALPAVLIPILVINHGWPYWFALPLTLLGAATIGGLTDLLVMRPLSRGPRLTMLVATIGLAQALFGFSLLIPRSGDLTGKDFPTPFDWHLTIGNLVLAPGQILILIVAPLCTLGVALFLRRSPLGRASRASAENTEAARLAGVATGRVSQSVWIIAGLLAGMGAILIGGTRPLALSAALGPPILLRALGAAMLGGLDSIWGSFLGGIAIGVFEALILWNYPVGGVLELVLAAVILVSMLCRPSLGRQRGPQQEAGWTLTKSVRPLAPDVALARPIRALRIGALGAVLLVAVLAPFVVRPSLEVSLSTIAIIALTGLSLVVLTGFAGNVSLGQYAFVGIGAALSGRLYQLGYPHLLAAAIVVLVGTGLAVIVGLPALRLRGLFLSVATLGFALATSSWLFFQGWLVHVSPTTGSSLQLSRPHFLGIDFSDDDNYYWLCLAVLVVVALMVYRLRRSGPGRRMIAVRDNEPSAQSLSLSPWRVKLTAFALSGAIASLAGVLYAGLLLNFSNNPDTTFGPDVSLSLVVICVFGGITSITGVVLGALWLEGIPQLLGQGYALLSSGIAVVFILLLLPGGLASFVFDVRDRLVARFLPSRPVDEQPEPMDTIAAAGTIHRALVRAAPAAGRSPELASASTIESSTGTPSPVDDAPPPLAAEDVSVRFGGLRALDGVSIRADDGEIVGLMGPNGAGKTTLFDVLSGNLRSSGGRVLLAGRDVTALPPNRRAKLGVGRTYQQARLFGDLTVLESVTIALECHHRSRLVLAMGGWPGETRAERARLQRAAEVLDLLDLTEYTYRPVSELPTGLRRMAELACVIALEPSILLLDEPTAGFTPRETASFGTIIQDVRRYLGATIIVIDHDVPMMRNLVDRVYVLAVGEVIAEGPPALLDSDEHVAEVFLGGRLRSRDGAASRPAAKPLAVGGTP